MKLRHQIALLLWVPLVLYVTSSSWFFLWSNKMYAAAEVESRAKNVISLCEETFGTVGKYLFLLCAPSYFLTGSRTANTDLMMVQMMSRTAKLKSLIGDNQKAMHIAQALEQDTKKLIELSDELVGSYHAKDREFYFSQFLNISEYWTALKLCLDRVLKELDELMEIYRPAVQEFEPKSISAKKTLNGGIIAAILLISISVFVLAFWMNKTALSKLSLLMNNMEIFSKGKGEYRELQGNDELAELDRAFKRMRDERNKLDELRKSMQAMLSHDIRSPLTALNVTLEVMVDNSEEEVSPAVYKRLRRMYSEVQRLTRLVTTLLDVEKLESGALEMIMGEHTCEQIVSASVIAVGSLLESKKITLVEKFDPAQKIWCDSDRTVQVLVNLLSNASKFTPKNSKITVSCYEEKEGTVRFEVTDEGPGVPAEKIGDLFKKFGQLDQPSEVKKQGTGLGLFICKLLIDAQAGSIGYKPSQQGGCFWFELKAKSASTAPTSNRA